MLTTLAGDNAPAVDGEISVKDRALGCDRRMGECSRGSSVCYSCSTLGGRLFAAVALPAGRLHGLLVGGLLYRRCVSVITRCLGAVLRAMTTMCVFTASFAAAADDAAAVECCLLYLLSARRNASDQFAVCQLTGTQIETEKIK